MTWIDITRVISFLFHLVAWCLLIASWDKVAKSDFHPRLSSNAYTMTDTSSMSITLANRGLISPMYTSNVFMGNTTSNGTLNPNPGFPVLTTSTILRYTQPIMIRSDDTTSETYTLSPSKSCTNYMLVNNNTAIWAACRASGVPMSLVDLTFLDNTLSLFGSNNIIALMYHTFFITWMLSMATLPSMEWNKSLPWPMISVAFLFGNFLFTICSPFTLPWFHFPINNAAIVAAMHLISITVILMSSRAKEKQSDEAEDVAEGVVIEDGKPTAPDFPVEKSQFKLHFLGKHLVSSDGGRSAPTYSNLWGRIHGSGAGSTDEDVSEVIRIVPMDGSSSATTDGNDMAHIGDMVHYGGPREWIAGVNTDGVFAMVPNEFFDSEWVQKKEKKMMMANFRYFEYSMTAGLFLISTVLSVDKTVDVYVLHMAFMGMLFCNIVAIPMTKALVFWFMFRHSKMGSSELTLSGKYSKIDRDYGVWIMVAAGMVLFASIMFFIAAMTVVLIAVMKTMAQAPQIVWWFFFITLLVYFAFAAAGIITVALLISSLNTRNVLGFKDTIQAQVITYEVLNVAKAFLGGYFMIFMLTSTGLSL